MFLVTLIENYCIFSIHAVPNPWQLEMAKSILSTNDAYPSQSRGSVKVFAHVLAKGNLLVEVNAKLGFGVKPIGGIRFEPVANVRTSSRLTLTVSSA